MRTFETGATRDSDDSKPDYEGFLSPLFLEGYGQYMHEHRKQADGTLRASDNWQKGIPIKTYQSSLLRHVFTSWALWRGWPVAPERVGDTYRTPTLLDALYAVAFNVMGMIHELRRRELHAPQTQPASDKERIDVDAAVQQMMKARAGVLQPADPFAKDFENELRRRR